MHLLTVQIEGTAEAVLRKCCTTVTLPTTALFVTVYPYSFLSIEANFSFCGTL
jgi:hypothetical protein